MLKRAKEMSAVGVRKLKTPGFHAVGGVSGLGIKINHANGKSWVLRTVVGLKRRDIGLGGFPDVQLASAREKARELKGLILKGLDSVVERRAVQAAIITAQQQGMTFSEAVERYLRGGKLDELRNQKHRKQWETTLHTYAIPIIGQKLIQDITMDDVRAVLEPIWTTKNETASRLRGRIETVFGWATVNGFRLGDNPARWKGNLQQILPTPSKVANSEHHPAVPIDKAAAWFRALKMAPGQGAQALAFPALNASRSGEVRGAEWSEIDLDQKVWTIPKTRMKAGKEHRVPLSSAAINILESLPRMKGTRLVFPSSQLKPLSDMTLSAVMRRMHKAEISVGNEGWQDSRLKRAAVPHGLRSTFRDWVSERTEYSREMAETALAHNLGTQVEQAYLRGDMLEKRREMMTAWSDFLLGVVTRSSVPISS